MKLNELYSVEGSTQNRKRVGRGQGSGTGKTSGNYRKLVNRSDERYDVVEIKTSPSLIVSWALSYGEKVEILDADIRDEIKKQLNKLKEMYKD